ncbi:type IV secretion system DNA-binding domain-containing protein [Bdellovibrionota bacterium FG-1]
MKEAATRPNPLDGAKYPDLPLSAALLAAGGVAALFFWLKSPRATEALANHLAWFGEINSTPLLVFAAVLLCNIIWIGVAAKQYAKAFRMGDTVETGHDHDRNVVIVLAQRMAAFGAAAAIGWYLSKHSCTFRRLDLLPFALPPAHIQGIFITNVAIIGVGALIAAKLSFQLLRRILPISTGRLPRVTPIQDGIVLGAIHEALMGGGFATTRKRATKWVYQGLRGLTGNLFLSGSIGSGKSQILLRLLQQILANFPITPSLLAIDPKRTFVSELREIIKAQGMEEHLLWVSLKNADEEDGTGAVKFNPIWREGMLRNSIFTSIANSLRLASINFLGSSGDNRFWEQASFNLLKNSLVYCAAKYEYFTFRELYRSLIKARDEGVGAELADCLSSREWTPEERDNITMALNYFKEEFSQMDPKMRTSVLATATGFLNEFLEYRVSQILSPARDEITLPSIAQAVREGKLICLNIENDSLARSIGTLFKLLYQEAVLERVNEAKAPNARYAVLVMDEYQDVATSGGGAGLGDDRYLAKARESKAITIAATQSVSSLENAIRSEPATREILQNFRTRIFGNSTDPKTIRLFQEPHGQVDRERQSHSMSESAQNTRPDLFGGYNSDRTSRSESVSTHTTQEFPITAREFSRLRPFESFAQIFDGVETQFEKLFLKPYFSAKMRTPHCVIMKMLRKVAQVQRVRRSFFAAVVGLMLMTGLAQADILFPNVCSVVRASQFNSCLGFNVGACMCGWPIPRPCAQISYYVPQTFFEVWPNSTGTFFDQHPAGAQLALHKVSSAVPFGVEDDNGTFAFQARSIAVPLGAATLSTLPCQGARMDMPCFDLMSEDLGAQWRMGTADSLQPAFLAWSLSPKACILKGAAEGLVSGITPSLGSGGGGSAGGCSFPLPLPKYPPSPREACNGWGIFFPRYGVYHGASRAGAALMIAARLKSLGTEVSHTIPSDPDEIWQMLYPQSSSCFKEGQNLGALETWKGVREEKRMFGKPNGYLFTVWKKVSCCRDMPLAAAAAIEIEALQVACQAVPGGGT